ncbi:dimeric dihydrodiol dehydrogenase [Xylariaceae sp. FL1019]|nr:dimeric dihydrodiol dehydrogenase [Xylariaceae sp. FL1019]
MAGKDMPTCRWGIITTGLISSWFVADLVMPRTDAKAHHVIQAIGSSRLDKSREFASKHLKDATVQPSVYGSYDEVYADPDVDCVYIGSPHGFHKRDCLAAIAAGKNVLCEKAFTINAREAREVFDAAKKKGLYVAEAMWLRHKPLVLNLQKLLHEDKIIGDVFRTSCDFQMLLDIAELPPTSRYKDLQLGAGTLLDIGIYSLTWCLLTLDPNPVDKVETPNIMAAQTFVDGVEVTTSAILHYKSTGRQGLVTSTSERKKERPYIVAMIDGTNGSIEVEGNVPSHPTAFTVYPRCTGDEKPTPAKRYDYARPQQGFQYEADQTALDIAAGRSESAVMPWSETIRVLEMMDEIRRQGGTRYPQDET